jgi:1-deoxy-D-xylulose-5-phosphate synthase
VIPIGKGRKLRDGEGVAILSYGHPGNFAEKAIETLNSEGLHPAHYNLLFVKPLDDALLHELFTSFKRVVTVEDGSLPGGFGSAVLEWMVEHGYAAQITRLGIPDRVVHQGTPEELHAECGYDAAAIAQAVRAMVGIREKV